MKIVVFSLLINFSLSTYVQTTSTINVIDFVKIVNENQS